MSRSIRKRFVGVAGALGIAMAFLGVNAGQASAVTGCNSPVFTACVWIDNYTTNVHSFRLYVTQPDGKKWNRCLTGTRPGGHTSTYSQVWYGTKDRVSVNAYTGGSCQSSSKTNLWRGSWSGPSEDQWWVLSAYDG